MDVVDKLIESIQSTPSYTVTTIGAEGEKAETITNYRAINSKTHEADAIKEIITADLVLRLSCRGSYANTRRSLALLDLQF